MLRGEFYFIYATSRFCVEDSQRKDPSAIQSNDICSLPTESSCCSSRDDVLRKFIPPGFLYNWNLHRWLLLCHLLSSIDLHDVVRKSYYYVYQKIRRIKHYLYFIKLTKESTLLSSSGSSFMNHDQSECSVVTMSHFAINHEILLLALKQNESVKSAIKLRGNATFL